MALTISLVITSAPGDLFDLTWEIPYPTSYISNVGGTDISATGETGPSTLVSDIKQRRESVQLVKTYLHEDN